MSGAFEQRITAEIEMICEFRALLDEKYEDDWHTLQDMGGEEDDGIEFYADEAWVLGQIRRLGKQLMLVALYRVVEHNIVRILESRWTDELVHRNRLYRFDRLRPFLVAEAGLDIDSIPGFSLVNELRVANNAVKHEIEHPTGAKRATPRRSQMRDLDSLFLDASGAVCTFLAALEKGLSSKP